MLDMNEWCKPQYVLDRGLFIVDSKNLLIEKVVTRHIEVIISVDDDHNWNYALTKLFVKYKNGRIDIIQPKDGYATYKEAMSALYHMLEDHAAYKRSHFNHLIVAYKNSRSKTHTMLFNWQQVRIVTLELKYLKQKLKHCYRITGIENAKLVWQLLDEAVKSLKSELYEHEYEQIKEIYDGKP